MNKGFKLLTNHFSQYAILFVLQKYLNNNIYTVNINYSKIIQPEF